MARLGDVCEKQIDTIKSTYKGIVDYIDISSVDNKSKRIIQIQSIAMEDAPSRARQLVFQGDILISTVRPNLNAVAMVTENSDNVLVASTGYCVLRCLPNVYSKYVFYFCQSPTFVGNLVTQATGASYPAVTATIVKECIIPLPPLDEQRKIAAVLDKVSDLIAKRRQQMDKLDTLVKARFVEMFGDPETNPYGFKKVTVGDVCSSIVRGPFGSALKKEFFVEPTERTYKVYEQKHAIQKSATIGTYYITAEKFEKLKRFECVAGDILMSCSGTMGELYQLPDGCERGLINQALCKFTLNSKILPVVFLTYMKQTIGNLETKGSGIQNIAAVSYVKAMPINLAPMDVQNQFAIFVKRIDKLKLSIQKSCNSLETLKKSLMQQYFG